MLECVCVCKRCGLCDLKLISRRQKRKNINFSPYIMIHLNSIFIIRSQESCASTKVFIASNFVKEQFLCYLLPLKNQLVCVGLESSETNASNIILGNITVLLAKDAAYLAVIINLTYLLNFLASSSL